MAELSTAVANVKAEFETLQQDYANALRIFESLGERLASATINLSSVHKQAQNEARPNPEVNATNPKA